MEIVSNLRQDHQRIGFTARLIVSIGLGTKSPSSNMLEFKKWRKLMTAQPNRYFAFGPYKAEAIGPNGWWGVKNKNGLNVLTFTDRPGHVFALEAEAKSLAEEWNNGKVFEYPPEPVIVPHIPDPVHDARFGKYIRTQRFVNGRWVSPIPVDKNWAEAVDAYVET